MTGALLNPNAGEVNMVPAIPNAGLPMSWPTDGREGGVPEPSASGPSFIQIGTEGGGLPAPVVLPNTPAGYSYDRRSATVLNITNTTLFLGPAERADIIVDFSGIQDGSKLILYNDAPAPVSLFDPRYDYYTENPDQTDTGGTPSTLPGYGPNTRTLMQIQVAAELGSAPSFNLSALQTALPAAYAQFQDKPIVPQAAYNTAFNANYLVDAYARIYSDTLTFFNGPVMGLTLTKGGSGYTSVPAVNITGGGGTGATVGAILTPTSVANLTLSNGGSAYTSAPTVTLSGGGGTGATATATLTIGKSVAKVTVTNGGKGYNSAPTISFSGGGGTGATANTTIKGGKVTAVNITNGGSNYTSPPTPVFSGGGGSGASATTSLSGGTIASLTVTNGGSGYTSVPTVSFSGGGGSGAAAIATLTPTSIATLTIKNGGNNYTSAPTINFSGGGGSGATATALGITMNLEPKAIVEDFDPIYGRMDAMLGVEVPLTGPQVQTTIPFFDIDPATEVFKNSDAATPIGSSADGTQLWKITHNGVDTHAIHWHMFSVQIINRVGWDGMIKPPDPNELGWKETVRMNPLEDMIVAMRPIIPNVPFDLPNSIRPLDVTMPLGSTMGFHNVGPDNEPAPVTNQLVNFGWEYVWHCHLLGHEENIMMRPISIGVAPKAPSNLLATVPNGPASVILTWTDNSINETDWTVQRATSVAGPWTTVASLSSTLGPATGGGVTYTDTTVVKKKTTYYYRVIANNVVGYTQTYTLPSTGYPHLSADSVPSGTSNSVKP